MAAVAPLILAWIIIRGHALSWPRGEMTAIVAIVALIMTLFLGVIDHPGTDRITIYNYSSPTQGADPPWSVGQRKPTYIYRHELQFSPHRSGTLALRD